MALGLFWQNRDMRRAKALDYITHSDYISHQTDIDRAKFITDVKSMIKSNKLEIIEEYAVSPNRYEIITRPGSFWLTSEFYNKISIIDTLAVPKGSTDRPQRTLLAYIGLAETGSKEYIFLSLLIVLLILALMANPEKYPHVYEKQDESGK
jgi:hypothetical protein